MGWCFIGGGDDEGEVTEGAAADADAEGADARALGRSDEEDGVLPGAGCGGEEGDAGEGPDAGGGWWWWVGAADDLVRGTGGARGRASEGGAAAFQLVRPAPAGREERMFSCRLARGGGVVGETDGLWGGGTAGVAGWGRGGRERKGEESDGALCRGGEASPMRARGEGGEGEGGEWSGEGERERAVYEGWAGVHEAPSRLISIVSTPLCGSGNRRSNRRWVMDLGFFFFFLWVVFVG